MIGIFKRKKILFGVILAIVIVGVFTFIRLFIYDSYRMPDTVSSGTTVIFDGSTLTLDIPDSALPSGITKDQIVVEPIPVSELPENLRGLGVSYAFRLEPDGLRFISPVVFSVELPRYKGEVPLVYQIGTNGTLEAIEDTKITINEEGVAVLSGEVSHFSILGLMMRLDFEIKHQKLGYEKLDKCRAAIEEMANRCERHENFDFRVAVSRVDFKEDGWINDFDYDEHEKGPNNQCSWFDEKTNRLSRGVLVESRTVGGARSVQTDKEDLVNYEIFCTVTCFSWTCPAGDENVSGSPPPDGTSTPVPAQPTPAQPTPTPKPSCNIPAFQACANTFSLQGCIDACPYVSATCPPGTPPDTDCKETDKVCSDACWNQADAHIDSCLTSNNCTQEEVIAGGDGAQR